MNIKANNIIMFEIQKLGKNNWKTKSKKYLEELEKFLDKVSNIKQEDLKRDILMQMLRCDDELTLLSEKLFEEYYKKGYDDAKNEIK